MGSTFAGKTVLVTGANRGLGQALVDEALRRGAERVYAGTRRPLSHPDERVTPTMLDVTDESQIERVVAEVESLDVLVNNAGVAIYDDLSDRAVLERHLAVNAFGPWLLTNAFLPHLTVHAVLAGPMDTDMSRDVPVAKASTETVARAMFDAVQAGEDDIFPDPISATLAESWRTGAVKQMERQNAALVAAEPIAA
jgi:short-subunit dehydrogenase